MFNNKLMKILGAFILLFILSFGLISGVCADNSINKDINNNFKDANIVKVSTLNHDLNFDDDSDDSDYEGDSDDSYYEGDSDDSDYEDYDLPNYYEWEWKGNIYYIDLDQFNLTDEELTELFTKRDVLIEEIENIESMIQAIELSRNDDTLLAIDTLYESINNIINNTEFNDLLLTLKNINITDVNSTFDELKRLLESIKAEYPDEDFTEIDYLMENIETLLNEDLEKYENLNSELNEKLAELFELFDKYPFLRDHTQYSFAVMHTTADGSGVYNGTQGGSKIPKNDSAQAKNSESSMVSAEMKNTGVPYFSLAILILILGLLGRGIKRKL